MTIPAVPRLILGLLLILIPISLGIYSLIRDLGWKDAKPVLIGIVGAILAAVSIFGGITMLVGR